MKEITSRENPAYKAWKKLAQFGRERKKTGLTLLEGMHLLTAWQAACGSPETVLVGAQGREREEIAGWLAANPDVRVVCLPDALLAELADTETPVGILAVVLMPVPNGGPAPDQDCVILDGIQDPGNLGTLLRTAAAAGFRQVLLSPDCVGAWSPKVLRAGQGAHFLLEIHEGQNLPDFLQRYQGTTLVTSLDAAVSLYQATWRDPLAWVFGSEGQGVRPATLAQASLRIAIPMPGAVESLNVGAAAAICLFETVRRRQG